MRDVVEDFERWRAEGERIALATVVSVVGSAPRETGATLAVSERDEISGSVSGGCVEPAVIEDGMRAIRTGQPRLLTFGITEEQNVEQIGLSCGGEIRVFVERADTLEPLARAIQAEEPVVRAVVIGVPDSAKGLLGASTLIGERELLSEPLPLVALQTQVEAEARALLRTGASRARTYRLETGDEYEVFFSVHPAPAHLVIVGAGHISIPLARIAKTLGYRVTVIDAREAFATEQRLPDADEILVEWPDEALERLRLSGSSAVAVLTHDDKFDVPALKVALRSHAGYVGAIGSRGTREQRNNRLRQQGVTDEEIARIHGPIGLDLGATNPQEIALAIMAQIVAERHGRHLTVKGDH